MIIATDTLHHFAHGILHCRSCVSNWTALHCTLLYPFVTSTFYTCSCAGVDEVILREQRDAILLLQRIPTAMPSRLSNAACIHLMPSYDSCVELAKIAAYHFQMWGVLHTSSLKLLRQELFLALEPFFGISNIQSTTKDQFANWANSLYHESIFLPFCSRGLTGYAVIEF